MSDSGAPSQPQQELRSPCISVCLFDSRSGLCTGCNRTLEEINEWPLATRERRQEILRAVARRAAYDRPS